MPTALEVAEREAQEAEAEYPEGEDAEEAEQEEATPEPEPEPEPAPEPMSEKEFEAMARKMDAESQRHEKRVRELLGEQWTDWKECPLCPVPGYVPAAAAPEFDPMQRMAVLAAMGDEAEPDYRSNPNFEACPDCNGYGDVLTGSKRQTNRLQGCPRCAGLGYLDVRIPGQGVVTPQPVQAAPAPTWTPPNPDAQRDSWNRPQGHPHYGIDPQYAGL